MISVRVCHTSARQSKQAEQLGEGGSTSCCSFSHTVGTRGRKRQLRQPISRAAEARTKRPGGLE